MQVSDANKDLRETVVLGAICLLLQVMVAPNVGMGNGRINFAVVFAGIYALTRGGKSAVALGFFGGFMYDMLSTSPIGLMACLLTVFSFALGSEERNRFADGTVAAFTTFGTGSFVVFVLYHFAMLLVGDTASVGDILLLRVLPTFAMTFLGFLPFAYYELRKVAHSRGRRVGGKSSGLRENYYDIRNL